MLPPAVPLHLPEGALVGGRFSEGGYTDAMAALVVPSAAQIRGILEESHSLWGAGLAISDYVGMWEELADTSWGRRWFSWRAWVDDGGRVLSSLKLYRPLVRIDGSSSRACAIGAVFTPRDRRRRGHAATMIRATLEESARRGEGPGFLFTDIGTRYYAALGFAPLPCEDMVGTLSDARLRRPPAIEFRTMKPDDLEAVRRAHERACEARPIAILRDREHWEFLLLRAATFFRRLDGSDLAQRFSIAREGRREVGYLVGVLGAGEWNLREAAAFDGDPATLARILEAGAAEARLGGATSVWGWFPRDWPPLVPSWRLRTQPRPRAIPMLRPSVGAGVPPELATLEGAFVPYLDQF